MNVYCRQLGILVLSLWLLAISSVNAQTTADALDGAKIGYVNIRKILNSAPQIEQINKKIAAEFAPQRQSINQLRSEMAALNAQYNEALSKEQKDQMESLIQRIEAKQLAINKQQQRLQNEVNLRRNEASAKLQRYVVNVVAKIAQEKQLDAVLNNTWLVYSNRRIDITPAVLAYLAEQSNAKPSE